MKILEGDTDMLSISTKEVLPIMEQYGNEFEVQLAKAWQLADDVNKTRMRLAFTAVWNKYVEITNHIIAIKELEQKNAKCIRTN